MTAKTQDMTPNRPYLLRALYDWICDNGLTPYILADAQQPGVEIPPGSAKDGKVVLNISSSAVRGLQLGKETIEFNARFGGVPRNVRVPVSVVLAIYAQENGQGMLFPDEPDKPSAGKAEQHSKQDQAASRTRGHLKIIK